jgi:hypothetical protein
MHTPVIVKLAFALDCTGSMGPWIDAAKERIEEIVRDVKDTHPNTQIEVALVAYRDYGDVIRRRVVDFSSPTTISNTLSTIEADGGDDEAEDVAGALDRICGLTWGPSDVRMVFHITDAPAHGMKFHTARVSDRYPGGDPDGIDPRDCLAHLAVQEVEFTFVRITSRTDMMIDVFNNTFVEHSGRFKVIDLNPQTYAGEYGPRRANMADYLSPAVSRIVSEAVTRHTSSQDT